MSRTTLPNIDNERSSYRSVATSRSGSVISLAASALVPIAPSYEQPYTSHSMKDKDASPVNHRQPVDGHKVLTRVSSSVDRLRATAAANRSADTVEPPLEAGHSRGRVHVREKSISASDFTASGDNFSPDVDAVNKTSVLTPTSGGHILSRMSMNRRHRRLKTGEVASVSGPTLGSVLHVPSDRGGGVADAPEAGCVHAVAELEDTEERPEVSPSTSVGGNSDKPQSNSPSAGPTAAAGGNAKAECSAGPTAPKTVVEEAALAWSRYLSTNDSIVSDMFAGQLQGTVQCTVCHNRCVTS